MIFSLSATSDLSSNDTANIVQRLDATITEGQQTVSEGEALLSTILSYDDGDY